MTIEEVKARTKVTDSQLDTEIEETDMISLAANFNNIETLPVLLGLNPAEQQDVKYARTLNDIADSNVPCIETVEEGQSWCCHLQEFSEDSAEDGGQWYNHCYWSVQVFGINKR